ncbi:MAG: baseplate J/gp47 family protein, partial [Actinomycetota bacterium]
MIYACCDENRRRLVAEAGTLNGIDYLEVLDDAAPSGSPRQRTLLVHLLATVPASLAQENVVVERGERVRNILVEWVDAASGPLPKATPAEKTYLAGLPDPDKILVVRTDSAGDFSTYLLRLVKSRGSDEPPEGFDEILAAIEFSFKVDCPSEFDCRPVVDCPEEPDEAPPIDYLSKDYPSFRRLVLDRVTQLVPGWSERSAADLGVALAELIAYSGDQLSYQQDAIATEAYLETARLRTSLRRHGLLVDYRVHDGCNARVWIHLAVLEETVNLPRAGTRFYTTVAGLDSVIGALDDRRALEAHPTIFEPLHDARLHRDHNEIHFYTWGDAACCLPAGATRATLAGHLEHLAAGDMLLFEEIVGPGTGEPGDADPAHRHVVRLTRVVNTAPVPSDPNSPQNLKDPLTGDEITEIEWDPADAPGFPVCISSVTSPDHGGAAVPVVSVARGNLVLADHGLSLPPEDLGTVPEPVLAYPPDRSAGRCDRRDPEPAPPRFRPRIGRTPLTFSFTVARTTIEDGIRKVKQIPFDPDRPAAEAVPGGTPRTLPAIRLDGDLEGVVDSWEPKPDLLGSSGDDRHFVVEVELDGSARLRFGDGIHGARPRPRTSFSGVYRVGSGREGNVGAETIRHVVTDRAILSVRNPLPARGGTDMEDAAAIRRRAPQAFRRQQRAVTPADYSETTEGARGVERAATTMRWTGSWHTVFVTVDRKGGELMDDGAEEELRQHVEPFRMAGHDIEFDNPDYVPLELELEVCVLDGYLRSDVRAGLFR